MKILSGLTGLIILLLAVSFALANRHAVTISLWPFSETFQAPLYLLTLGTFFTGLLLGGLVIWLSMVPHRLRARRLRKDLNALQNKIDTLHRTTVPSQTVIPPRAQDDDEDDDMPYGLEPTRPAWKKFR